MTPEKQRIAIAEACGRVQRPDGFWYPDGKDYGSQGIPDYLNDLNAMHEAEKVLAKSNKRIFGQLLQKAVNGVAVGWTSSYQQQLESLADIAHATAAERAEAFLRALGKWEDDK